MRRRNLWWNSESGELQMSLADQMQIYPNKRAAFLKFNALVVYPFCGVVELCREKGEIHI